MATTAPAPDLPEARSRFAGASSGVPGGMLNHVLVVQRVDAEGADVLVAYGANEGAGIAGPETKKVRVAFQRNRLNADRADLSYWFAPDGALHVRLGIEGGPSILGTLHRNENLAGLRHHGTVGAVALDRCGDLAAGTSTGGYGSKTPGRVGDSPIIGAGTYADDDTAALSATGHGEYFMRFVVAHDIAARMRYGGQSLRQAAEAVVLKELAGRNARGGIIAVDREGEVVTVFNSPGMIRGRVTDREPATVADYE